MHPARAYKIESTCRDLAALASKISKQLPELRSDLDTYRPKPAPADCFVQESVGSVSALRTELAVAKYRIRELENKVTYLELCQDERGSRVYRDNVAQTAPVPEVLVLQTHERLASLERELAGLLKTTSALVHK